jgi:hypothetical protein
LARIGSASDRSTFGQGGNVEKLVFEAKFQPFTREATIISAVITAFLLFIGLTGLQSDSFLFRTLGLMFSLFVPIPFGALYLAKVIKKGMSVQVYEDRVELVSTFFRKTATRFEASKIESVEVSESLLMPKVYGRVNVRGSGGAVLYLTPIIGHAALAESIRKISSAPQSKAKLSKEYSSGSTNNLVEELKELEKLRKDGVISDAEFKELKKKAMESR